jgi:hypothetical protein
MILVALFGMIVGVGVIAFAAWWLLGFGERFLLKRAFPICGVISLGAVLVGIAGVNFGRALDTDGGLLLALSALLFGPLLGGIFAVIGLLARERPALLPTLGLLGSIFFVAVYWLRL